ncbi:MAG: calcineurin-like phosphoesterase C-terminal domain-containing protein [Alistipes sp.]
MSAHPLEHQPHPHKNGKEIFEHITGTSCGAWWRSTVCTEGTPIGFGIYRIDGRDEGVDLQIGAARRRVPDPALPRFRQIHRRRRRFVLLLEEKRRPDRREHLELGPA